MYIDESGDTISLPQGGKGFLVLTGCIIKEEDKVAIEEEFRSIKQKYYQDSEIEIKSNFLRYANPDLPEQSPIKLKDRKKYDDLEKDVANLLKKIPVVLYSVVIHKTGYWRFQEVTLPKLYKDASGRLLGYELKFFPDESKKGLRFFS